MGLAVGLHYPYDVGSLSSWPNAISSGAQPLLLCASVLKAVLGFYKASLKLFFLWKVFIGSTCFQKVYGSFARFA